ncbi:MAG: GIY-YIG nuclease family protein [Pyrinomonadaceae bacterium]
MKNFIEQMVEGRIYASIASLARAYSLEPNRIQKRHHRGKRGDDLIPKRFLKSYTPPTEKNEELFVVGNHKFKNPYQACKERRIDYGKYRARLRQGWTQEEALELVKKVDGRTQNRGERIRRPRNGQPLFLFGKEYKSYKEVEILTGIKSYVLWQRVNLYGKSLEEAVLMEGKNKKVKVGKTEFDSEAEFARAMDVEPRDIYRLLDKYKPFQITEGIHKIGSNSIDYLGNIFPSFTKLAAAYKLTVGKLRYRLDACDGNLEQALSIPENQKVVQAIFGTRANFYIAEIGNSDECEDGTKVYKIGVTQYPLEKRYRNLRVECHTVLCKNGDLSELKELEKKIKQRFKEKRIDKYSPADFDGFSEVFQLDSNDLNLIKFLAKFNRFELVANEEELALMS